MSPAAPTPAVPGDWSGLVVICATTPWDGNRLLDQHLALGLSRYAPVLYVDPAVPVHRLASETGRGTSEALRLVHDRIARLTPRSLPGHQRPGMKAVTIALVRRALRRAVRSLGATSVNAVIVPSLNRYFGALDEGVRVFYAKDDYVAGAGLMRLSTSRLQREMRRQPHEADLVVAASPALAQTFHDEGFDPLLLPNGCDVDTFAGTDTASVPSDVRLPSPIAGVIGQFSSRTDGALLEAVAERGHSLLLIGPHAEAAPLPGFAELVRRPNVAWIGARPFAQLPSYLRLIDVGLVPYSDTPFNQASFPLKALEYLAAGRPVVSTDLAAMRWLGSDDIHIATGPDDFADRVSVSLAQPRTSADTDRRRRFAEAHSWTGRTDTLAAALGLAPSSPVRPPGTHDAPDAHDAPGPHGTHGTHDAPDAPGRHARHDSNDPHDPHDAHVPGEMNEVVG